MGLVENMASCLQVWRRILEWFGGFPEASTATLDAALVLGVMIFGDLAERLPASYTPALAVSWVMFLLLALTAMRFKPALVLYLGGLLIAGLAAAMALDAHQAALAPRARLWDRYLAQDIMPSGYHLSGLRRWSWR